MRLNGLTKKGSQKQKKGLRIKPWSWTIQEKNFKGDKIKVDREVRGEPKECNVPEAKKEGSAARR